MPTRPDPGYLRNLLQQDILRIGVDHGERQTVRGDAEHQNRRVGRVDLPDQRRIGQARRQIRVRGIDGRQRVADRAVNLAIQVELQRDLRVAERARGRHLGKAGISPNCSSSGEATVDAMVCGSAPGSCAVTVSVG